VPLNIWAAVEGLTKTVRQARPELVTEELTLRWLSRIGVSTDHTLGKALLDLL